MRLHLAAGKTVEIKVQRTQIACRRLEMTALRYPLQPEGLNGERRQG